MAKRKLSKWPRRNLLIGCFALLLLFLAVYLIFRNPAPKSGTIPSSNPAVPAKTSSGSGSNSNSGSNTAPSPDTSPQDNKTQSNTSSSAFTGTLVTPYGNFVSNHHPGGNAPTSEASVCNTSAGASCYIEFTKDGVVKKLAAQTTDSNGATYWYWDTSSAGLTAGTWSITAVASAGGQTKSASDSQSLIVQ